MWAKKASQTSLPSIPHLPLPEFRRPDGSLFATDPSAIPQAPVPPTAPLKDCGRLPLYLGCVAVPLMPLSQGSWQPLHDEPIGPDTLVALEHIAAAVQQGKVDPDDIKIVFNATLDPDGAFYGYLPCYTTLFLTWMPGSKEAGPFGGLRRRSFKKEVWWRHRCRMYDKKTEVIEQIKLPHWPQLPANSCWRAERQRHEARLSRVIGRSSCLPCGQTS
mmetsp:Transcript_28750/g.63330  ORF Transcript_28750/g.63330 Transcript_28750/m.63330 type:complete len:217 (-) Transcript_28750:585-1235(-)